MNIMMKHYGQSQSFHWTGLSHNTTIQKTHRLSKKRHRYQKVHPQLQELHYHWETKEKQYLLARDEIVVLHVTHTDTQPDRVVMKQRPSWLHYISLKTKIPQRSSSLELMCYRQPGSPVHPSERLLADGWHSEQRAPNPL